MNKPGFDSMKSVSFREDNISSDAADIEAQRSVSNNRNTTTCKLSNEVTTKVK